jgi:hypothetical protein
MRFIVTVAVLRIATRQVGSATSFRDVRVTSSGPYRCGVPASDGGMFQERCGPLPKSKSVRTPQFVGIAFE